MHYGRGGIEGTGGRRHGRAAFHGAKLRAENAATALEVARSDTYQYLKNLRSENHKHIDAGGVIIRSLDVDQAAVSRLDQFEALAGQNAQAVFEPMERE